MLPILSKVLSFHKSKGRPLTDIYSINLTSRGSKALTMLNHFLKWILLSPVLMVLACRMTDVSSSEEHWKRAFPPPKHCKEGVWFSRPTLAIFPAKCLRLAYNLVVAVNPLISFDKIGNPYRFWDPFDRICYICPSHCSSGRVWGDLMLYLVSWWYRPSILWASHISQQGSHSTFEV